MFLAMIALARAEHTFEVHAQFVGATHDYTEVPLALTEGRAPGAAGAVTPFQAAPYDAMTSGGGELGVVDVNGPIRVGVAYRWLYPNFSLADGVAQHAVVGETQAVSVRGARLHSWRWSLGAEAPWRVAPFVDLVGEYHGLRTPVALDGVGVVYEGDGFGFAAQAGLRVPLGDDTHTHLLATASYGLWGHPVASAALGLAWRW